MKAITFLTTAFILMGCVSTPTVKEADDSESINTISMTCSSPYELTQDCSIWSGATKKVKINNFEVNIAGSNDRKVTLVMDSNFFSNSMKDFLLLNSPTHSKASNNSLHAVKSFFIEKGIIITRIRPVESLGNIDGYVLELESDGYTLLKTL